MTDMATTPPELEEGREILAPATTSAEAQTVISEQQVLFGTAAAVALPPAKTRRWIDAVHALRAMFAAHEKPAREKPAKKPVYPKRHVWLENSLMSREMDRL